MPHTVRRSLVATLVVAVTGAGFATAITPVAASAAPAPAAAGSVSDSETTMGYDNQRTNWDSAEPGLSPTSVKATDFGQVFDTKLPTTTSTKPNQIYAQPIVADGLVIVATEDDDVAALTTTDGPAGKAGTVKWRMNLGTPWTPTNCSNLVPHAGITSTPVYDPKTDALYVAAKTAAAGRAATYKLHALNARTGRELSGWPVTLGGKSTNGGQTFNATTANQRTGLLLMNGSVYLATASHCDQGPYVGFVVGVDTTGNHKQSLWAAEAKESDSEAGIWQSGGGLIADGTSDILLTTGNGISPAPTPGKTPPDTLAESVVRLHVDGNKNMSATDFFSPANNAKLDQEDADLGAGAPISLPAAFGTTKHPHLLMQDGKDGVVRLLDRDNLGGNAQGPGGTDADLAEVQLNGLWGRFAAFPSSSGNYVFLAPRKAPLTALTVGSDKNGNPSVAVRKNSTDIYPYNSGSPIVTSDGTDASSAVVWVVKCDFGTGAHAYLQAYAMPPSGSGTAWSPLASYSLGTVAQFIQPATANGRVYVGTRDGHVKAYGRPVASALNAPSTDFGLQPVTGGQPMTKNVVITATKAVTVKSIATTAPFTIDTSGVTLPMTLAANDHITVPVTFTPTAPGSVTENLAVTASTGTLDDEYDFGLHGTGTQDGLQTDPTTLDYGDVNVGESKELSATITNTGATTATITGVIDPGTPYTVRSEPSPGDTLAPQASVNVTVRYSPTDLTQKSDMLVITADTGSVTVPLTGTGFDGQAHATFDHTALDFGNVPLGGSKTLSFTITNDGTATLVLTKAPPPSAPYSAPRIEGQDLAPGDELTVPVTYTPTTAEPATDGYFLNGEQAGKSVPGLPQTVSVVGNERPWTGPISSPAGCVFVLGSAPANGTPVIGQRCFSATAEEYAIDPVAHTLHYTGLSSKWCVDVAGAHKSNGSKVQIYTCNGGRAQQWYWRADDSLYNPNSGKCLDMPGGKIRVQLQLRTCNRTNEQYWNLAGLQSARGAISSAVAPTNAVCLDIYHAHTANKTPVQIYTCNRGIAQQITQVGNTLRVLGSCIDVRYNGTANGTPVWLYRCNGGAAQQWTERANGVLYNPHSGKCLDVPHSTRTPGTQLQIYTCHGGVAQSWNLPA